MLQSGRSKFDVDIYVSCWRQFVSVLHTHKNRENESEALIFIVISVSSYVGDMFSSLFNFDFTTASIFVRIKIAMCPG